jgi:streptomycin 6-kinase
MACRVTRGRRPIAVEQELKLGEPYEPGGQCAWVAPARHPEHRRVILKVEWRHPEAEHEADALRLCDGDGAIRCPATHTVDQSIILLLERCVPGVQLKRSLAEPEQDLVIAGLLRRLWAPAARPAAVRFSGGDVQHVGI